MTSIDNLQGDHRNVTLYLPPCEVFVQYNYEVINGASKSQWRAKMDNKV